MQTVRSVDRSLTSDSYCSLRIYRGESCGKCSEGTRGRRFPVLPPGAEYPSYANGVFYSNRIAIVNFYKAHNKRSRLIQIIHRHLIKIESMTDLDRGLKRFEEFSCMKLQYLWNGCGENNERHYQNAGQSRILKKMLVTITQDRLAQMKIFSSKITVIVWKTVFESYGFSSYSDSSISLNSRLPMSLEFQGL